MIYSSASSDIFLKAESSVLSQISPKGGIMFFKIVNNLKSLCEIEITLFPYDEQKCTFILASTMYDTNFIRFIEFSESAYTFILDRYIENKL